MASEVIAVLVELPLCVQFDDFAATFDLHMLHLLTQHVGLIGFKKGRMLGDDPSTPKAVVLALWRSMEANNQFLDSEAAERIDEQLQPLIHGPVTMTRWQLGIDAHVLDYIPYTNFRKFRMPFAVFQPGSQRTAQHAWLAHAKGLNVLSICVDECANNRGCHPCDHSRCTRDAGRLMMLSLNGLSPDSIRKRIVQSEKGAELVSSFTVEWITSIGSERSSDWGSPASPVSREDTPPQRLSRESSGSEARTYWNTILGETPEHV